MKVFYFGSRISPNMTKTPEGFLICHNVPIARTGYQEYYENEFNLNSLENKKVKVYRSPEEVFSKETIASFEGKSITDNHPPKLLDLTDVGIYSRGHITNVRIGEGEEKDFLLADLFITDQKLIDDIENNNKREVSSGYMCQWVQNEAGDWEQKEIRGNHVAVVPEGRAGKQVAIKDEKPKEVKGQMKKQSILGKMFKAFAIDAEPDEIEAAAKMVASGNDEEPEGNEQGEINVLNEILKEIKGLSERVAALESNPAKDEDPEAKKDGMDELEDLENDLGSKTVEDEKPEEEKTVVQDSAAYDAIYSGIISQIKPVIANIKDKATRDSVAKSLAAAVKDSRSKGIDGYAEIIKNVQSFKLQAQDSKKQDPYAKTLEACEAIRKHNAQNKGGN